MARKNAKKKWGYTDEQVALAAENGIDRRSFVRRLSQGWSIQEAMTKPVKRYGQPKIRLVDKQAPWYLYQYYGMFGKW